MVVLMSIQGHWLAMQKFQHSWYDSLLPCSIAWPAQCITRYTGLGICLTLCSLRAVAWIIKIQERPVIQGMIRFGQALPSSSKRAWKTEKQCIASEYMRFTATMLIAKGSSVLKNSELPFSSSVHSSLFVSCFVYSMFYFQILSIGQVAGGYLLFVWCSHIY